MGSRLSDYYDNYYQEKLKTISNLDYGPDFTRDIRGHHLDLGVKILDDFLKDFRQSDKPRVLEIGVGTGALMHWLKHKGLEPEGVDISETNINNLRDRGFKAYLHDLNETPLQFPENTFDAVVSLDVIEHVICPIFFMSEVYRVCKPGGHAIVSTANVRSLKHIFRLLAQGRFPKTSEEEHGWDCGHLHYFTSKDVAILGKEKGFDVVRILGASLVSNDIKGLTKKLLKTILPSGFAREFLDGSFLVLFRK